jgi:RNA polymerase sigma-70 factor (ECF subfamily)
VPEASVKLEVALEVILAAKVSGDESGLGASGAVELVRRFTCAYLRRRDPTKDASDIDDISQEVLLKVWRYIESYDPRFPAGNWIGTIASRTAVDSWRRAGHGRTVCMSTRPQSDGAPDMSHISDTGEGNPAVIFFEREDRRETGERIRSIIAELPDNLREAITLRMDEVPYADIAKTLQIPLGTVKSRVHLGMRRIEKGLAGYVSE